MRAEDNVAEVMAAERARRGWTPGELARRMTTLGCPMNQSSIWKIENSVPRRKITVDELIAMAAAFDVPVTDLLAQPYERMGRMLDLIGFTGTWREQ